MRRLLVKVGGAVAGGSAKAVLELAAKHEVCVVHGAGPQISVEMERAGIPVRFIDGRRVTSIEGIGALMIAAQRNFQSPQVYGLLVLIGLFGLLVNSVFAVFEAILLRRWPPKTQSENF